MLDGFRLKFANLYLEASAQDSKEEKKRKREVARLLPFHPELDAMFDDVLTTRMVLPEWKSFFPELYAVKIEYCGEYRFCQPMRMSENNRTVTQLVELLQKKKSLFVRPCSNLTLKFGHLLSYLGQENYSIDGIPANREQVFYYIENLPVDTAIIEYTPSNISFSGIQEPIIEMSVVNSLTDGPTIAFIGVFDSAYAKGISLYNAGEARELANCGDVRLDEARGIVRNICNKFREVAYFNIK